jgi:tetratricopeptide (TPR) repeat protein
MAGEILSKALESKYRLSLAWRNDSIDFLGLPTFQDDRAVPLEAMYVTTRLTWEPDGRKPLYLASALRESRHLVVLGGPGAGKSTLAQIITYSLARSEPSPLSQMLGPLLPIPVLLRDYSVRQWTGPTDMLRDFISTLDGDIRDQASAEWLLEVLRAGRGALVLDGVDEVGSVEDRRHLRDEVVLPLLSQIGRSVAVLTSRIIGYDEVLFDAGPAAQPEDRNTTGPLARRCYIAPFGEPEIREYIRRFYSVHEANTARRLERADALTHNILGNRRIRELAEQPGLLALMALIHRVTRLLPLDRLKLYERIVDAYLESIQVYRNLPRFPASLEEMKRWLATVGWELQCLRTGRDSQISASQVQVVGWISEAMGPESPERKRVAAEFLDYATRRGGLLVMRGPGQVIFAHLSFQEYFAAWQLRAKIRRFSALAQDCSRFAEDVQWHETLLLLFGMLGEFPGAADDLVHELARTSDAKVLPGVANLLLRLLVTQPEGLRTSRKEALKYVFSAWLGGTLRGVSELGAFFSRFSTEYEEWASSLLETVSQEKRKATERGLAVSFGRMANLLTSVGYSAAAKQGHERAIETLRRLASVEPDRADLQRDLFVSYNMMGDLLVRLGQGEHAREFFQKALQIAERLASLEPGRTDLQRDLSISYSRMGGLLASLGQGERAREFFQKDLQIAERLASLEPDRVDLQRDLSISYSRMGGLLASLGQGERAREFFQKDLQIAERLASLEPDRADLQRDLSVSYNRMGDSLASLGQGERAREFFQKDLQIAERLASLEPDRADLQRDLSVSYNRMGDSLASLGQDERAREFFQRALQIRDRLANVEPDRADLQRDLSISYNKMGDLLVRLGQGERAREFFHKALQIRDRLASLEPNRADLQRDLSVSYNRMGDLLVRLGQGERAREFFHKDLQIAERLASLEPDRADLQRDLSVSYNRMGDSLASLGQGERAREFFQKALEIAERLASLEPDRADFQLDLALSLIRTGTKADLERALALAEDLARREALPSAEATLPNTIRHALDAA